LPVSGPPDPLPVPTRALAIGAHPDDIEFGAGGTLARWAASGCEVSFLVLTDGSKGSWSPDEDQPALVARRQIEQRAAAEAIGVRGEIVFGGWIDGELESGVRQRVQVTAAIRRLRPDVVLGHDPWKRYRLHPDHRHAGLLVTDGIVAARDPLFYREIALPPHRPRTLLLFEADEADHAEAIDDHLGVKIEALLAHGSQLATTMAISNDRAGSNEETAAFARRMRDEAAQAGERFGLRLAEAFKRIDRL
jgi:LmbE family N-acetylglucosaminyl deacetylase